jgi:hypothetical protein
MKVHLFDTTELPPWSQSDHVFVYAGMSAEHKNKTVTYVDCVHEISGHLVEFRKNSDPQAARFEDALEWAVSYGRSMGVREIYAVYVTDRELDLAKVRRICPEDLIDCRQYALASKMSILPSQSIIPPIWIPKKPAHGGVAVD